jgi:hypothetical protein
MNIPAQHGEAVRHAASALAATGEQPGAEITAAAADLLDHTASMLRADAEAPSRDALDLLLAANEVVTGRRPHLHRDHLAGALRDLSQAREPRMQ